MFNAMAPKPNDDQIPNLCGPQEIVTIIVSNTTNKGDAQTYQIYRDVLCRQSPFFAGAFEGETLKDGRLSITLDDVGPEEFGIFVHWLHYRVIRGKSNDSTIAISTLINLWILGDRFMVPQLCNDVMDILYRKSTSAFSAGHYLAMITRKCEASITLRQFAVDLFVGCTRAQCSEDVLTALSKQPDMMKDVFRGMKMVQEMPGQKFTMPPKTKYYVKTGKEDKERHPVAAQTTFSFGGAPSLAGENASTPMNSPHFSSTARGFGMFGASGSTGSFGTRPEPRNLFGSGPINSSNSSFGAPAGARHVSSGPSRSAGSPATAGGLFGGPRPAASGGLFGSTPTPPVGGLFGSTPTPSVGGLFGSNAAPPPYSAAQSSVSMPPPNATNATSGSTAAAPGPVASSTPTTSGTSVKPENT